VSTPNLMPSPSSSPSDPSSLDPRRQGVLTVVAMLVVMWVVEIVDSFRGVDLEQYGIEPRHVDHLTGVVAAPFLHANFSHLIGNSIPFTILGATIALSGAARVLRVTLIVGLIGGLGTWLVGPYNSLHIGASGLVFGFAAYLISRGLFSRSWLHLGVGIVVGVIYGSTLAGGLIPQDGISWQGHLFGGLGGIVAARVLDYREPRVRGRRSTRGADPLAGL
jgi:membrane associated rhomboid family serine protease